MKKEYILFLFITFRTMIKADICTYYSNCKYCDVCGSNNLDFSNCKYSNLFCGYEIISEYEDIYIQYFSDENSLKECGEQIIKLSKLKKRILSFGNKNFKNLKNNQLHCYYEIINDLNNSKYEPDLNISMEITPNVSNDKYNFRFDIYKLDGKDIVKLNENYLNSGEKMYFKFESNDTIKLFLDIYEITNNSSQELKIKIKNRNFKLIPYEICSIILGIFLYYFLF